MGSTVLIDMPDSGNLRPYYDADTFHGGYSAVYRPGVGVIDEHGRTIASKLSSATRNSTPSTVSMFKAQAHGAGYGSGRGPVVNYDNIQKSYSDLEFTEYFDYSNVVELVKSLTQSLLRNYAKIVVAQPFEVSRLILQVGDISTIDGHTSSLKQFHSGKPRDTDSFMEEDEDIADGGDDDPDEEDIDYFVPRDEERKRTRVVRRNVQKSVSSPSVPQTPHKGPKHLTPMTLNTMDVMSSLLSQEGVRGLWRATNTTFVYNTLNATLEAWITGFVSIFLSIPDPFFVEVAHSPRPTTTLMLSLGASVLTALILAPLDLIRTRLVITKIEGNERSLRNSIKHLKFSTCPLSLVVPTALNSLASTLNKKLTPYLLTVKLGVDSTVSPSLYGSLSLLASVIFLTIKLPVETLLRRAQISYMMKRARGSSNKLKIDNQGQLIVKFGGYSGIFTTLWDIFYSKGENSGLEGIFRGWRVGVLNVIGSWGLELLRNNYDDQVEEKF